MATSPVKTIQFMSSLTTACRTFCCYVPEEEKKMISFDEIRKNRGQVQNLHCAANKLIPK